MQALSVCIGGLIVITWFRSICDFELGAQQNKVYMRSEDGVLRGWFRESDRIKRYLKEVILILPHPMIWL